MIDMKVTVNQSVIDALERLPMQVLFKCVDPAAKKMAPPIIAAATMDPDAPDSSKTSGTQRWANPASAPRDRWSSSARAKYDTGPSHKHMTHRFWKTNRGGILYVGMKATQTGLGKKMHFRLPTVKKSRVVYYWGKPGQVIMSLGRTYIRGDAKNAKLTPGSKLPLEEQFFIRRAMKRQYATAYQLFESELFKRAKELRLG